MIITCRNASLYAKDHISEFLNAVLNVIVTSGNFAFRRLLIKRRDVLSLVTTAQTKYPATRTDLDSSNFANNPQIKPETGLDMVIPKTKLFNQRSHNSIN
ncbi:hypothetical protein PoB_000187700 [Plakobranchus ocellatus]|uniref:Uncharacterized protein n=1 Tax=Plakobranchus ocellatus TaxID=259542 RepID=A0AAV3XZ01_9GAST|nr:hypothetical protein PoB_000187700 [Plakobranchus ocellatus]